MKSTSQFTISRYVIAFILLVFLATCAQATFYTVTLKNGTTFETRYRPIAAEWDSTVSMLITDKGNWIALANEDIADVVSVYEENGFGYQLDVSTRYVGWSPNDLVNDKVDEEGNVIEESDYDPDADVGDDTYSIDQFLSIPLAGGSGDPSAAGGGFGVGGFGDE